jgi:DNA-binding CsgD family transcriptional regulator
VSEALLTSFLARARGSDSKLTNRERGVVQLIAEGHTNREIADILNISVKTVEKDVRLAGAWLRAALSS